MAGLELTKLLDRLHSRPDPMLSFKWVILDDPLPFGLPGHYVEAINLPFHNLKAMQLDFHGGVLSFPEGHDIADISMTLYEDSLGTTIKWLMGWKAKVKNFNTGAYNLPKDYKKDIRVALLNTKNELVITAVLYGLWPTATSDLQLNYTETSGRITIQQAFPCDGMEIL